MTDNELKELVASLAVSNAKNVRAIAEKEAENLKGY